MLLAIFLQNCAENWHILVGKIILYFELTLIMVKRKRSQKLKTSYWPFPTEFKTKTGNYKPVFFDVIPYFRRKLEIKGRVSMRL